GVGDDGGHLGNQAGDGGHHEAGGTLAVDDGLDLVRAGLGDDFLYGLRVVVDSRLVEIPMVGLQVDAGAPVFQPDVVPGVDKVVDHGTLHGSAKEVGAYAGSMGKEYRSLAGWIGPLHMNKVAGESVAGLKRDDLFGQSYRHRFPRGKEMEEKCRAQRPKKLRKSGGYGVVEHPGAPTRHDWIVSRGAAA